MRYGTAVVATVLLGVAGAEIDGQVLLDRVAARVHGVAITLSDVRAAVGLGLVAGAAAQTDGSSARALIDRHLMLAEVRRFLPPEPAPDAVRAKVEELRLAAGSPAELRELLRTTGLTDAMVEELAQDSLRLEAYLGQRFGAALGPDAVETWLDGLRRRGSVECLLPGC